MSSQTSGVTGRDPIDMAEPDEAPNLELFGKEPLSSEWTDEKHSLYLKSMEASFVHQLYNSLESSGLRSQRKKTESNATGQRIQVGKAEPTHQQLEDQQFLLRNPWIRHFRTRSQNNAAHEDASNEGQTTRRGGRTMYTCGLVNITEHTSGVQAYPDSCMSREYSGQNFDKEDNGGGGGQVA